MDAVVERYSRDYPKRRKAFRKLGRAVALLHAAGATFAAAQPPGAVLPRRFVEYETPA